MTRRDTWIALTLPVASFALYALTTAPSVVTIFDDSLEFHVVLPTLGIAHPSGYPLYTLVGYLSTILIPFRDPAGRANLFSALAAAIAVGMLYLTAQKLAGGRLAAFVATVAFAVSPVWWAQATIAEVYALHGLFVMLFLYSLLRWEEGVMRCRQTPADGARAGTVPPSGASGSLSLAATRTDTRFCPAIPETAPVRGIRDESSVRFGRWLVAAALTAGLGLAHHRMIALLFPAALAFVFWTEPTLLRQPRRWWRPILAGLAPLLLYLYLPIRGQMVTSLDGTYKPTWLSTLNWILAREYRVFLTGNPFGVQRGPATYVSMFLDQFGALLVIAALLGLTMAWRFSQRRYALLLLATVSQVAFGVAYKVQDVEVFFIPAFLLLALWAAWGLTPQFDSLAVHSASIARRLRLAPWTRPLVMSIPPLLIALVLLLEPARALKAGWPQRDRSADWKVYDYGQDMIASAAPGGQIIGLLGETTLVRYFRDVLGERPDVTIVAADSEGDRFAALQKATREGIPAYLTRDLPGVAGSASLDASGPLIAVSPKEGPAPAPAGQDMGSGVVLVDVQTIVRATHAGLVVRVMPVWSASAPISEELKVSARLLDAAGQVVMADDRVPVHFTYPTTAWVPGELVHDLYDLPVPSPAPSGPCSLLLILYRAADGSEVGRATLPAPQLGGG